MAINIKFDSTGNPEQPTIILATRNGNKLGQLDAKKIELKDRFVEVPEIAFVLYKYSDGKVTNLWDKVVDFKLIYCKEWDLWFEINVELDEETETIKTVFGKQLAQAELSQIMLYGIEINTENDIARDDYKSTVLYSVDSGRSLLNRILEKAPHYSVVHVDGTIASKQRTFTFDDTSIYDAFQEIAKEIGCLFVFNSGSDEDGKIIREISVYDLQQNCLNGNCRHRGEFTGVCPKCGGTNISYGYGKDTSIFVTSDELAFDGIQLTTDADSVKNCFNLEAGDDLMTATIRNCNPNGTSYIWRISNSTKADMSKELVKKLEAYDELYRYYYNDYTLSLNTNLLGSYNSLINKYSPRNDKLHTVSSSIRGYPALMKAYYDVIDMSLYLETGLMPTTGTTNTTGKQQASLLESSMFSNIAVSNAGNASLGTVNSAVLNLAKTIVGSGYKVDIGSSQLIDIGDGTKKWSGNFIVTSCSDEKDTFSTNTVTSTVNDDKKTFILQKIEKALSKENTDKLDVTGLFGKNGNAFSSALTGYALNPLSVFQGACRGCLDILVEQGVANNNSYGVSNGNNNLYQELYVPFYSKLKSILSELTIREDEIGIILGKYDSKNHLVSDGLGTFIEKEITRIQNELNFERYLGTDLWLEFCAHRREDKYSNDNYISDGLDNTGLFERALEFMEVAENEIYKASEPQYSIEATLKNLLAIPKFKPLINSFEVGNWIRARIDDEIYKLRLLSYDINYDDFNSISVEFSNVTKIKNGITDIEDILSRASSMSTSYDTIKRQARQGNEAQGRIEQWLSSGLNSALVQIQSNDTEDITITKNGLLCRSYDDITDSYAPEQLKLTHNLFAYTDDDWESVKQAIGKHEYMLYDEQSGGFVSRIGYGLSADFVIAGVVSGSQIIGGDIYSDNYSKNSNIGSYINLRDGTFSFGGGALIFDGEKLILNSPDVDNQIIGITQDTIKTTDVTAENLTVNAANITGKLTANQIDATELRVNAANIDGKLVIGNIDGALTEDDVTTITNNTIKTTNVIAQNLKVRAANITGTLTIGNMPDGIAMEDDILTSDDVTTITNNTIKTTNVIAQNLRVNAANIDGVLTIGNIPNGIARDEDILTESQVTTITNNTIKTATISANNISGGILSGVEVWSKNPEPDQYGMNEDIRIVDGMINISDGLGLLHSHGILGVMLTSNANIYIGDMASKTLVAYSNGTCWELTENGWVKKN